jgi:hypothetical protein
MVTPSDIYVCPNGNVIYPCDRADTQIANHAFAPLDQEKETIPMSNLGRPVWQAAVSAGLALITALPAQAQTPSFTGTWSVSGQMVAGKFLATVAPVCTLQQAGSQVTGTCKGPNGIGPATGMASGANISWEWMITPTTPIAMSAIATFKGTLGPDGVVRGTWTNSNLPNASGPFTAQRT